MEENLKRDVIREVRAGEGRILLHDEVEERPGVFKIIPIWEQVDEQDIMTPRDVYNLMVQEGYKVRPQLPLHNLRMVDFSMDGVLAGRLWPGCSGTLSCYSPVSCGLDVSHPIARVDGRTGPASGRALANADARAHRAAERPGHRLHLQLPDGPWSHDQRNGHRLPDRDYDDLGTRQGGQVLGRRAEH